MKEKIQNSTKVAAQNISDSCKINVDRIVNAQVEKSLSIPDNLILLSDKIKSYKITENDLNGLETEVEQLINEVKEV